VWFGLADLNRKYRSTFCCTRGGYDARRRKAGTYGVTTQNSLPCLVRPLTDIDVPSAEPERSRHRLLLVLEGRARQIEVHLVLADFLRLTWQKPDPEPGVITRQERKAVLSVVGHLPAEDAGPEMRETVRVVRVEAERDEVRSHSGGVQALAMIIECPRGTATIRTWSLSAELTLE
jgi:hypothetical protein